MNQNPKQIILEVLDLIGYEDDKEKFANDFLNLCLRKAFVNLIQELPQEKQDQLIQRMNLITPEKVEALLLEYFPKDRVEDAMRDASAEIFEDYLKTIIPTLNSDQRLKLEEHLSRNQAAA